MKLTEEQYLDLQQATKLSRPTIYKALNGQETTKANEYIIKLAYLEMIDHGIDKEWLNEKIFELDQMIEQL